MTQPIETQAEAMARLRDEEVAELTTTLLWWQIACGVLSAALVGSLVTLMTVWSGL